MIEISVDEKACVACSLCAEMCPTDVFVWDEDKGVPEVAKPAECFGCLSCSEICPPHCITHKGVDLAESHYHDPYALRLANRLAADVEGRFHVPSDTASQVFSDQSCFLSCAIKLSRAFSKFLAASLLTSRPLRSSFPLFWPGARAFLPPAPAPPHASAVAIRPATAKFVQRIVVVLQ